MSIMKRYGYEKLHNVVGGFDKMAQEGFIYKKE